MARADFNVVPFNHDFDADSPDFVSRDFPIEGDRPPVDDAFLLIQVRGVRAQHSIIINRGIVSDQGIVLEPGGLMPAPGNSESWRVGLNMIPPGALRLGGNRITIQRFGNDNFRVGTAVFTGARSAGRHRRLRAPSGPSSPTPTTL